MSALCRALCLSLLAVPCILLTNAQADPFSYPPETNWSDWVTSLPYQRNVSIDFGVSPVGSAGSGIPGAVYSGTLDSSLKAADYAQFYGDVTWYASVPGLSQTGLIGIDNRNGTTTLSGYVFFNFGNTSNTANVKHVWEEFDWLSNQGDFGFGVFDTLGLFDMDSVLINDLGGGVTRFDAGWTRAPNPAQENIGFQLSINPGKYFLFDNLHVATECVPEPGTLALLGVGLLSLFACGHQRRKQAA
jgi:hypothetical protein